MYEAKINLKIKGEYYLVKCMFALPKPEIFLFLSKLKTSKISTFFIILAKSFRPLIFKII